MTDITKSNDDNTRPKVGYVGLGAMGGALALRLVGNFELNVWDLDPKAAASFDAAGTRVAPTAIDLARASDIVLLCLPRSADVHRLLFGSGGMVEGLAPGSIVIDQTSGVPEETRAIARLLQTRGVAMLDAPVAGGVAAAKEGRITMMVSGSEAAFERAAPVLRAISPTVVRCGDRLGDGQAIKMLNNAMNAACRVATLEVVAMGRKQGLTLASMTETINQSTGRSRISMVALTALEAGKPSSDFALPLMLKDVDQALALSMQAGAPLPLVAVARGLLQIGVNTLGPGSRLENMIGLIESMAGTHFAGSSCSAEPAGASTMPAAPQDGSARRPVIGCVGLGEMGAALARCLLQGSYTVHVHDVRADAMRALEAAGATAALDLPTLARSCDVIMLCLPTSTVVRQVLMGKGGLAGGLSPGKVVIDRTTGDPNATRAIAAELDAMRVSMIDAPFSGGASEVVEGTAASFCGGPTATFAQVRSVLARSGPTVVHVGSVGNGNVATLIHDTLGVCNHLIAYESLALGAKAGLSLADMERVINKSSGWSLAFERIVPVLANGGQTAQRRLESTVKRLDLACRIGMEVGAPMLVAQTVRGLVAGGANELGKHANLDDMSRLYEMRAGIKFSRDAGG